MCRYDADRQLRCRADASRSGDPSRRVASRTTALRDGVGSLLALGLPASVSSGARLRENENAFDSAGMVNASEVIDAGVMA